MSETEGRPLPATQAREVPSIEPLKRAVVAFRPLGSRTQAEPSVRDTLTARALIPVLGPGSRRWRAPRRAAAVPLSFRVPPSLTGRLVTERHTEAPMGLDDGSALATSRGSRPPNHERRHHPPTQRLAAHLPTDEVLQITGQEAVQTVTNKAPATTFAADPTATTVPATAALPATATATTTAASVPAAATAAAG